MSKKVLKEYISQVLLEFGPALTPQAADIWDSSYSYSNDGPGPLVQSALAHFKKMGGQGMTSPADPKFLNAVAKRLQYIGVPNDVISVVLGKLRMSK